jgi:hypothetical protein
LEGVFEDPARFATLPAAFGAEAFIPRYLNTIGWVRIECGTLPEDIAWSERSYELTNRSSRVGHGTGAGRRAFIRNNEADALMGQGDFAAASLNSPRVQCAPPRLVVAVTSIERSPIVRAILRASRPNLTAPL